MKSMLTKQNRGSVPLRRYKARQRLNDVKRRKRQLEENLRGLLGDIVDSALEARQR